MIRKVQQNNTYTTLVGPDGLPVSTYLLDLKPNKYGTHDICRYSNTGNTEKPYTFIWASYKGAYRECDVKRYLKVNMSILNEAKSLNNGREVVRKELVRSILGNTFEDLRRFT